ncbi:MAG: hypothetical protein JXB60_06120 [Candidatus Cloacimonetes bacterium]|nr:hypothetical protein [Candidatus Cloacimonadota bacterium]
MRKSGTIILLFLISFYLLTAANFNKIYHRDYGEIDRTVLVFDQKPIYSIIENQYNIQIEVLNCAKNESVQNQKLTDSNLLQSFTFYPYDNNLIITIALNESFLSKKQTKYYLESLELEREEFKLVLDIFSTRNPRTIAEHQSFANFYNTVGFTQKAKEHLQAIEKLRTSDVKTPPAVDKVTDDKEQQEQPITPEETEKQIQKTESNVPRTSRNIFNRLVDKLTHLNVYTGIIILVILVLIIFLMIFLLNRKPATKTPVRKTTYRSTDGFGDEDFRKKMVAKLAENGWENEAIAKEMNIKVEEVARILKSL